LYNENLSKPNPEENGILYKPLFNIYQRVSSGIGIWFLADKDISSKIEIVQIDSGDEYFKFAAYLFIAFGAFVFKKKHDSAHVDQHGLQGIVTVSYKTYRNTYQISRYVSLVEKMSIISFIS
jgi:hypothetical protein